MPTLQSSQRFSAVSHSAIESPTPRVPVYDESTQSPDAPSVTLEGGPTGGGAASLAAVSPSPDSRSPLELVVSEATAIRALSVHYGWIHLDANTLRRRRIAAAPVGPLAVELSEAAALAAAPADAPPAAAGAASLAPPWPSTGAPPAPPVASVAGDRLARVAA
jgi:hypothetical protein